MYYLKTKEIKFLEKRLHNERLKAIDTYVNNADIDELIVHSNSKSGIGPRGYETE